MKVLIKLACGTLFAISLSWIAFGQLNYEKQFPFFPAETSDSIHYCGTSEASDQLFRSNPEMERLHNELEKDIYRYLNNNPPENRVLADYTLPVVVHIIHNNGSENISDALIFQGIEHLNESFANTGYYDQGTGVNTQIEFCMAERDPDGNATNGITRDVSTLTDMILETEDIDMKNINRWDPLNYINIWVVREICSNSVGCGVAGYAYFPSSHGGNNDGIVIEANWMGSSNSGSTVLSHEMGHYLGLYHTFEGGCTNNDCLSDGDRVCDTPPDQSTATVPCNGTPNTCTTDVNPSDPNNPFTIDQNDMFWNYMDYGDWNCYSAFTNGQALRMEFFINSIRASLLDSEACLPACMNTIFASFTSSVNPTDIGTSVNFINNSIGANNYEWLIDGVPFSSNTNATYNFSAEGFYVITLNATNSDPNCFETFSDTIEVVCPVIADFNASAVIAGINETVTLTNGSSNATAYEWFLNGASQGNAVDFSFSLSNPAVVQICLESFGPLCEDTHCEYISIVSNSAAGCDLTYIKTLGDLDVYESGQVIIPALDGDFFIGGARQDSALLMKISPDGIPVWSRTFKLTNGNDLIYDLVLDTDNRLVITGYGLLAGNDADCFAFKYDHVNDSVEWLRTMPAQNQSRFWGIAEKPSGGNYIVVGQTVSTNGSGCNAFVLELDRNSGSVQWMKNYHLGSCESAVDVVIENNSILITGRFNFAGGGTNKMRGSLTRLDFSGNELWSRLYLVPVNSSSNARIYSTNILVDDEYIISVSNGDDTGSSTSDVELHLYATDLNGNIQWAEQFNLPTNADTERTAGLAKLSDGYLIYGHYSHPLFKEIFLIKTNKQGQLQWSKTYGNAQDQVGTEIMIQDGFIYLLGNYTTSSGSEQNIFLAKVNMDGELSGDCGFVFDLDVDQTTINNPYDGLHPLTVSDPSYPTNAPGGLIAQTVALSGTEICSAEECCTSQTYVKTFGRDGINEGGSTIIPSNDGNLFVSGYAGDSAVIMKMSPVGDLLWTRAFKFTNLPDRISEIKIDSDNNMIACGSGIGNGNLIGFAFKYDFSNDNVLWSQRMSSSTRTYNIFEPTPGGNYIVTGDLNAGTVSGTGNDASLFELDRNTGIPTNGLATDFSYGGSETFSSAMIYNGFLYTFGRYTQGSSFGGMRSALTRFDFSGNEQWSKMSFVPLSATARIYGRDVIEDNGDLVMTISGDDNGTSATVSNFFLQKTDSDGNIIWLKKYDIQGYGNEWTEELIAVSDGYVLFGYNRSGNRKLFLVKTDKDGNTQWAKQYGGGGDESISFIPQSQLIEFDGFLYFLGESNSFGDASNEMFVVKTDLNGDVDQDCDYVVDLDIETIDFASPVSTTIDLIDYNSGIDFNAITVDPNMSALPDSSYCSAACNEICNNGIDDDGDELIDFYDPDCPCLDSLVCGAPFYNICAPECEFPIPPVPFDLEAMWSQTGNSAISQQAVGDVDGDCIPDVVAIINDGNEIEILNSNTGVPTHTFATNTASDYAHIALGDVDNDGMAEIFYIIETPNGIKLVRLDYVPGANGIVQTWQSSTNITGPFDVPVTRFCAGLADFDYNGSPEIYVGNQIFNSQNGLELANGGQNNQGTYHIGSANFMTSTSIAADVLSDSNCSLCEGLELVAGGQVYTVNIASYTNPGLNDMSVEKEYFLPGTGTIDGATRLVDFDKDGDLDVVVSAQTSPSTGAQLFVWDILNQTLLGNVVTGLPNSATEAIGASAIGDVDNDGWPEIIVSTVLNISVLEDFQNGGGASWGATPATIKASFATTDLSGLTGASLFDLNGDGVVEIIHRDEDNLRIFDGDLNELYSTSCTSITGTEYPIVADVNGDGETELLCGCDNIGLTAFHSASLPWIKSRKIWNQYNYFVSNINDDGSVPIQQQNPHIVGDSSIMNGFLLQQPILDEEGAPINPAPDAALTIDSSFCTNDSVEVFVTICNTGAYTLSEITPITIYFGDPTTTIPILVQTLLLGVNLEPDSCLNTVYTIPSAINQAIFIVVNDDGSGNYPLDLGADFPITSVGECDFQNNIGDTEIIGDLPPPLDLGPDVVVCDNGIFEFNAGPGFENYEWQDGSTDSTFTTWLPGTFWVKAWNACGEIQTDTVQVVIDSATVFDLGLDTVLCGGGTVTFSVAGYDRYEWFPNINIDCDTCEIATITPLATSTYTLVTHSEEGCVSVDSIEIIIADTFYMEIDTSICEGETFTFDGMELDPNSSTYFNYETIWGCDSTILVSVNSNSQQSYSQEIDTLACYGASIVFDGVSIPADSIHVFDYQTVQGCDSTITISVMALDTFYTLENESICEGESILVFGTPQTMAGDYSMTYNAVNGCDSTVVIALEVFDVPAISLTSDPSCPDDSTGTISVSVFSGNAPFTYNWSSTTENVDGIDGLPVGTYSLTLSDFNNCSDTASVEVSDVTEIPVIGESIAVSCYEASDGTYQIDSVFTTYLFSLDGNVYQNTLNFLNLDGGTYDLYVQDPNGCEYLQNFSINEPSPLVLTLPQDTSIQLGCSIELASFVNRFDSLIYSWNPTSDLSCLDCPSPVANPLETTTYTLTVIDSSGCSAQEDILVRVDKQRNIYIPNVFSPNFDGINDVFMIYGGKGVEEIRTFTVFDRWGAQLFEARNFQPEDSNYGWDGTFKEKDMNPGVFVYWAEVVFVDGQVRLYKGSVTLVK